MTNITPEQLKKVAEYMGYKTSPLRKEYNPLQKSDQDAEIEIKLRIETTISDDTWIARVYDDGIGMVGIPLREGKGETPKEARLNCAIAYVEGLENEQE